MFMVGKKWQQNAIDEIWFSPWFIHRNVAKASLHICTHTIVKWCLPSTVSVEKRSSLYNVATPNALCWSVCGICVHVHFCLSLISSSFLSPILRVSVSFGITYVVMLNFVTMTTPTTIDSIWLHVQKGSGIQSVQTQVWTIRIFFKKMGIWCRFKC